MKRLIFKMIPQALRQETLQKDEQLISLFQQILRGSQPDHWYESLLLSFPSESYLLQFMEQNTPIEALHHVLSFLKKSLGQALCTEWETTYNQNQTPVYHYNPVDIGRRALKNISLAYLTASEDKKFYALAYRQLENSDNMTDQIGALAALIDTDCKEREQALQTFYEQWKTQPLIVNKWLALQAASTRADTLEKVKALLKHPAFNIQNPNNVYALLCTFGENVTRFHAENGEGYRFIAEQVRAIDPKNSQVAARVLQPLTRWGLMDKKRQALMKEALQSIAAVPQLSKAVYEIVEKSLK